VHFVGRVRGDIKSAWLDNASLFVLPSRSEAFPMALLEAFAHGRPALMTTTCGLPEAAAAGAAIEVDSTDDGIAAGLEQMLRLPPSALAAMGAAAQSFVGKNYNWPGICRQLESVYTWMRTQSDPPPCLRLD
jgi:poly(glycerol-phosphate) alpha-glucosyltransferase